MPYDYLTKGFRIGDNVGIKNGEAITYYTITHKDSIFYVQTHSAIAAGATQSYAEITNLDPPKYQLYQLTNLKLVRGNVSVYVKQPASTNRFGTNRSPDGGYLTDEYDNMNINLFVMEDYPPNVQIVNNSLVSTTPRLRWLGHRYQIVELPQKPEKFTPIGIGGLAN